MIYLRKQRLVTNDQTRQAGALSQDRIVITPQMVEAGAYFLGGFDRERDDAEETFVELIRYVFGAVLLEKFDGIHE